MSSNQETIQRYVEANQSIWSTETPQQRPRVILDIEHETIVKARTRNRMAQRKHREKTSLRNASSIGQAQDTSRGQAGQARARSHTGGTVRQNSGVHSRDLQTTDHVQQETLSMSSTTDLFPVVRHPGGHGGIQDSLQSADMMRPVPSTCTDQGSLASDVVMANQISAGGLPNDSTDAYMSYQATEQTALDNLFPSASELMLGTLYDDLLPMQAVPSDESTEDVVYPQSASSYATCMDAHMNDSAQRFEMSQPVTAVVSSSAESSSSPRWDVIQTGLLTPEINDQLSTPPLLLPVPTSALEDALPNVPMTAAITTVSDATHASSDPAAMPFSFATRREAPVIRNDEVSRLEKVLDAIDEAGFDSIESMMALYYESVFPSGSPLSATQSLSKKRRLQRLLVTLRKVSREWDSQESQGYREGIMKSAEDIVLEEMSSLTIKDLKGDNKDETLQQLESVLSVAANRQTVKENKRVFREQATETWSLLTELGNAMDVRPAENSQIVFAFLYLLIGRRS